MNGKTIMKLHRGAMLAGDVADAAARRGEHAQAARMYLLAHRWELKAAHAAEGLEPTRSILAEIADAFDQLHKLYARRYGRGFQWCVAKRSAIADEEERAFHAAIRQWRYQGCYRGRRGGKTAPRVTGRAVGNGT